MPKAPNVIVCMCDELRFCELGCYGHPAIRTPHIDRLAAQGTRFDVAISNNPVCMPARSILLSGQYARTCNGILGNLSLHPKEGGWIMPQWPHAGRTMLKDTTVPEAFRAAGYRTTAVGKWHVEAWPDEIGFDHYIIPANQHAHSAQWFCEDGRPVFSPPGYSVDYELARVQQLIRDQPNAAQPLFLYYNISPPHMPLADAPEKYTRMYSRDDVVVRGNVDLSQPIANQLDKFLTYLWDYRFYRDDLPYTRSLPWDGFDLVDLTAMYMGLTTWVDDTVAGLVAALDEAGLAGDTLLVFTSDHGDNLGSFGRMGKGSFNDESLRIPMIARGPGIQQQVTQQVGSLIDLGPTLLAMVGAAAPDTMQGRDLSPVLRGEMPQIPGQNHAFAESQGHGIAIRTPTHMLSIPWVDPRPTIADMPASFHDATADPFELNNLATSPDHAATKESLETALRTWHTATPWTPAEPFTFRNRTA